MKIKRKKYQLGFSDIKCGECFQFLDCSALYIKTDKNSYVCLSDGTIWDESFSVCRDVQRINAEIVY